MRVAAFAALWALAGTGGSDHTMISLNHFFVTVDPEAYRQIVNSQFLKNEFAPFETRTTVRADSTYTGAYFYGRNTYFEFFPTGADHPLGASGLAFGTETPGGAASAGGNLDLITRGIGDQMIPWFQQAGRQNLAGGLLSVWLMEYHPDFLRGWHAGLTPVDSSLRRADVLDRYVSAVAQSSMRDRALLQDVIEIDVAVPAAALDEVARYLGKFCKEYQRTPAGFHCSVEGTHVRVNAATAAAGITRAVFSLQGKAPRQQEYRFGTSGRLVFSDETAAWHF